MTDPSFSIPDTEANNRPSSSIDIYSEAIASNVDDELLDKLNLGLGNYSRAEHWQQIQSFQRGLYADNAFSRRLEERAISEAKRRLALEGYRFYDQQEQEPKDIDGWEDLDEEERAEKDRRRWIDQHGEQIWNGLTEDQKLEAILNLTGYSGIVPPHWRMMMMRHETSRSKNARLLDNVFGRVKEVEERTNNLEKRRNRRR